MCRVGIDECVESPHFEVLKRRRNAWEKVKYQGDNPPLCHLTGTLGSPCMIRKTVM